MIISLIVAASTNNAIGKDNKLLWHLPNDMKFFKNTTWGMPVVMGRKTFEALAGEPLPGRFNFVITRNRDWRPDRDKVQVCSDLPSAIEAAKATDCKETFIIGGGEIYKEAMSTRIEAIFIRNGEPHEEAMILADRIYMTRVHAVLDGDTFFPVIDERKWKLTSNLDFPADEKHAYAYSFQLWEKRTKVAGGDFSKTNK